jgi:hypothetical protein
MKTPRQFESGSYDSFLGREVVPPALNAITDAVLAYKPQPKSKAAKRRARKEKRKAKDA